MANRFYQIGQYNIDHLKSLTTSSLDRGQVPLASEVKKNIPIYDVARLGDRLRDQDLHSEWIWVLREGPGVLALANAYGDREVIDRASSVFQSIIDAEKGESKGDHFAASGANDRVWNALQKMALHSPDVFAKYYGNAVIAAVSAAWLGPHYQMTSQVNQVRPGGKAQSAHRDYHLGFQTAQSASQYPAHVHELTAALTLQGAVAHCDMPIESGPTKLLPFSQLYPEGYLAFHDEAHRDFFEQNYVQLELSKGDAVFFNPALLHSAGANVSKDIHRMANLLQVSSAFGRAMEAVDGHSMCLAVYPHLSELNADEVQNAISACAEGYPFPTNLDTDPPVGGNAPMSQADLMRQAFAEKWTIDALKKQLDALRARQGA